MNPGREECDVELFAPIDAYCERWMVGFWAEPVNALSNIAFIIAGYFVWRLSRVHKDQVAALFALNVALIGVGSFLFHTFANGLTAILDVVPILIYMLGFLGVFLRRFIALKWVPIILVCALFLAAFPGLGVIAPMAGLPSGMILYLPALLTLVLLTLLAIVSNHALVMRSLALTTGLFAVSLTLRTLDLPLCTPDDAPGGLGTHFAWHGLNGIVLYRLSQLLINIQGYRHVP